MRGVWHILKNYIVIEGYENSNKDPIELKIGDIVQLGEKSDDNGPWANWIYCVSDRTAKTGWTPVQILQRDGKKGIAKADYIATEMTVSIGDTLIGDAELNGWIWCIRKADGESGWVPQKCLSVVIN